MKLFLYLLLLVCIFVVIKSITYSNEIHFHEKTKNTGLSLVIIFTLMVAIVLPAKALTTTTAVKRFDENRLASVHKNLSSSSTVVSTNSQKVVNEVQTLGVTSTDSVVLTNGTSRLTLIEDYKRTELPEIIPLETVSKPLDSGMVFSNLISRLDSSDDLTAFQDKEVELVGFVLINKEVKTKKFFIVRFFIACCTADANPTGIQFMYDGNEFKDDEWVKIKGKINIVTSGDTSIATIVPYSIEKTEQPEFPYAYY